MYLLAERIANGAECVLYVQDVCITHDHRDEVLHVITLLPSMPQFAKVEVYTQASIYNTNNILFSSLASVPINTALHDRQSLPFDSNNALSFTNESN